MRKKELIGLFTATVFITGSWAQTVNKGKFYITEKSLVSSKYVLENKEQGDFRNNGVLILHSDVVNNGEFFDYKGQSPQGKTIFTGDIVQRISGESLIKLNNVEWNNPTENKAFEVSSELVVAGEMAFKQGIVHIEQQRGALTMLKTAQVAEVGDHSHVQGSVESEGDKDFIFPVGHSGFYRPAKITAPEKEQDIFGGEYTFLDNAFFEKHKTPSGVIKEVNTNEYWKIERGVATESHVILSLSWDERITPASLLKTPEHDLRILRWDESQELWRDEGGIVDKASRTVTSPVPLKAYGYFTLGTVKTDWILDGDVVIYTIVSPNGDGKHDYFIIDHIDRYPGNHVMIFNRWGAQVFETDDYGSRDNVFKGYSEGKGTVKKGDKLPSGTYYYIVSYPYKTEAGVKTIKKVGYLQLENN